MPFHYHLQLNQTSIFLQESTSECTGHQNVHTAHANQYFSELCCSEAALQMKILKCCNFEVLVLYFYNVSLYFYVTIFREQGCTFLIHCHVCTVNNYRQKLYCPLGEFFLSFTYIFLTKTSNVHHVSVKNSPQQMLYSVLFESFFARN